MTNSTRSSRLTAAVVVLASAVAVTACDATARADKAGGRTTVIRLATIDEVNNNGQSFGPEEFVAALEDESGGRLKVEIQGEYGAGVASAESDLVEAIAAGEVDGGWPSVRAFANAGLPGLEAVEAPLTLSSIAAQKALVTGPVGDEVLSRLDGTGVVGLGLAVGELRRPFAREGALLGLDDWKDQPFRVYHSPTEAAAVTALGAEPMNLGFVELGDALERGSLRGVDGAIAGAAYSGGNGVTTHVTTNVVLWPKVFVLAVSDKLLDRLTDEQRTWVRAAAERAVRASAEASYDESDAAAQLCRGGYQFSEADDSELAALRRAVRPVLDELAASATDEGLLAQIQEIAQAHPGPEPIDLPEECSTDVDGVDRVGAVPAEVSSLPEGSYRVEVSTADLERASITSAGGLSGTWTLQVDGGTYQFFCRPLDDPGTDCGHAVYDGPLEVGDLKGTGHVVYFVSRPDLLAELTGCSLPPSTSRPGACWTTEPYRMTWAIDGDELTLSDYVSGRADVLYLLEPWVRIG